MAYSRYIHLCRVLRVFLDRYTFSDGFPQERVAYPYKRRLLLRFASVRSPLLWHCMLPQLSLNEDGFYEAGWPLSHGSWIAWPFFD